MKIRLSLLAPLLLAVAGLLAFTSLRGDSAIIDEVAHLPAGYSYVTRADLRLNPEHPPLLKDLAGLAVVLWSKLSGTPVAFPASLPSWSTETNGEWSFGPTFLYRSNTTADAMLLWGRLPTLLIMLGLGVAMFVWARRRWGEWATLLALFLYVLSPTVLAHARFVTTDIGATAAFFAGLLTFLHWLERPSARRLILAGLVLGFAQLVKFSLLLLIPLEVVLLALWVALDDPAQSIRQVLQRLGVRTAHYLLQLVIAFGLVVMPVYMLHVRAYPSERQRADIAVNFERTDSSRYVPFLSALADKPVLRAAAHYLTGVLMVRDRSASGSSTFLNGEVYLAGRPAYFPILFAAKEPAALLGLTLVTLVGGLALLWRRLRQPGRAEWLRTHFTELSFCLLIIFYWTVSIHSALNIGIRHVLPTFPFIFLLVSRFTVHSIRRLRQQSLARFRFAVVTVAVLLGWQAVSVVRVHPSYLAYFNEFAGGPSHGNRIVADSNLDWGQDLKRLATFANRQGISRLAVDYFGGGSVEKELGSVAVRHHAEDPPVRGWLAVSETYLTFELGQPVAGVKKQPNRYAWLDAYTPVTVIGHSIAVYNIP